MGKKVFWCKKCVVMSTRPRVTFNEEGVCSACQGKLISGSVEMEVSDGLSDDELEEGYILCCVSHPTSDQIEVEID